MAAKAGTRIVERARATFPGKGPHYYCSDMCRFIAKVNKTEGCWLWTAATANGYGRFGIGGGPAPIL